MSSVPNSYSNSSFESFYEIVTSKPFNCYKDLDCISELSETLTVAIFGNEFDEAMYALCKDFIKYCFYSGRSINPDFGTVLNVWKKYVGKDVYTTLKTRIEQCLDFHSHESRVFLFYYMENYFKSLNKVGSVEEIDQRLLKIETSIYELTQKMCANIKRPDDDDVEKIINHGLSMYEMYHQLTSETQCNIEKFIRAFFEVKDCETFNEYLHQFDVLKADDQCNYSNLEKYTKKIIQKTKELLLGRFIKEYPYTADTNSKIFLIKFSYVYSFISYINILKKNAYILYMDSTADFDVTEEQKLHVMHMINTRVLTLGEEACCEQWKSYKK